MDDHRLFIGDLAGQAGMAPSAIRYYESAGLLQAEARTDSGYRVYGGAATRRLLFIQRAKALGFRLSEIKRLIAVPPAAREDELAYFNGVLMAKLRDTRARISGLRAMERSLRRLESTLAAEPPPASCHLGDCVCWLPA